MRMIKGIVVLLVLLVLGCGTSRPAGDLPELRPTRGVVTRGGQPVSGGALRLKPVASADNNLRVSGLVGADGAFELSTMHALSQRKAPGAPAGEYTVTEITVDGDADVARHRAACRVQALARGRRVRRTLHREAAVAGLRETNADVAGVVGRARDGEATSYLEDTSPTAPLLRTAFTPSPSNASMSTPSRDRR